MRLRLSKQLKQAGNIFTSLAKLGTRIFSTGHISPRSVGNTPLRLQGTSFLARNTTQQIKSPVTDTASRHFRVLSLVDCVQNSIFLSRFSISQNPVVSCSTLGW